MFNSILSVMRGISLKYWWCFFLRRMRRVAREKGIFPSQTHLDPDNASTVRHCSPNAESDPAQLTRAIRNIVIATKSSMDDPSRQTRANLFDTA